MNMLSANQRYKLSGTSLSFADWIEREKAKGIVIPQKGVTDIYMEAVQQIEPEKENDSNNDKKVLGLNKNMLLLSALIVLGALTYNHFKGKK